MKNKFYVVYRQYEDGRMTQFKRHKCNGMFDFSTREKALEAINALPETHSYTEYRIVEVLRTVARQVVKTETVVVWE